MKNSFIFLFSCLENATVKRRSKTIPTLGQTCSHRGTHSFPAWDKFIPSVGINMRMVSLTRRLTSIYHLAGNSFCCNDFPAYFLAYFQIID